MIAPEKTTTSADRGEIVAIRGGVLDVRFAGKVPRMHDLLHAGEVLASGTPDEIVARVVGSVVDQAMPTDRARAWRHRRRWRQWDPRGVPSAAPVSLEDAAIVAELSAAGVES